MTPLENKIWNLVSNWAEKQYHPINDFALRGLMDEILKLVNEESKEAEIKKLVSELETSNYWVEECLKFIPDYKSEKCTRFITFKMVQNNVINKLEKILTDGK